MDFALRQKMATVAVLSVRQVAFDAVFTPKDAVFNRYASSHHRKIDGFLRETSNTSADSTVCTASECYEVFAEKAAILHPGKVEGRCILLLCRGAFLHKAFYS